MDVRQAVVVVCNAAKRAVLSFDDNEMLRQAFAVLQAEIMDQQPTQQQEIQADGNS